MTTSKVRYQRINPTSEEEVYTSLQFKKPEPKVPYKSIGTAFALFVVGAILIVVGSLLLTGFFFDKKYADRTWPVLTLGILTFLPGFYHLRIAILAWLQYPGYSFEDIPSYGD